jgi:hypothetical protein
MRFAHPKTVLAFRRFAILKVRGRRSQTNLTTVDLPEPVRPYTNTKGAT